MKRIYLLIIAIFLLNFISVFSQASKTENHWLKPTKFSLDKFSSPSIEFAPFTRWWWPGNDVTKEEIKREIEVFKNNYFGGVEIQPFALVMPTKGEGRADRIMSYDTPLYYENLAYVMQQAEKAELIVDLTDGSGWPPGGSHISKEDGNFTLEYGITNISKKYATITKIPRPVRGDDESAKLVSLLAVKLVEDTTATQKSFVLDPKTIIDITSKVKGENFTYTTPEDNWKAIAIWSVLTLEKPMIIAKRDAGFVYNHFDSLKVQKNYNYLFGDRTGLQNFYGKPLRAIFDDSYEFKANRHFSNDFISEFKKRRGYDITPFLPANLWLGYNNMYIRMEKPGIQPDFILSDQDWRLRYDYDYTLSNLLGEHFLKTTKTWTESRGMLHRTQTYGLNMDIMASAGLASIPEVETMLFSKGSENGYKLITSGAHLYNRPIISSETAVYYNRAYMTTPQKIKLTFDKLFSSGVNQVIYHGTPYMYYPEGYPKEGWYPFYNSALGINFSSDINENNPFWKYISKINKYAQRIQYVLRSGKPNADVLIYYPFLNYSESSFNPKEVIISGQLSTEPPLPKGNDNLPYSRKIDAEWLEKVMPLIDELNQKGITWDWVNDASIQEMKLDGNKKMNVRGNIYQSLVLFNLPYIQLKSAEIINSIAEKGGNILLVGAVPTIQPSYFNYEKNDKKTFQLITKVSKAKSTSHVYKISEIDKWANLLYIPISYAKENPNLRQQRRFYDDNSYAQFIWNESNSWQDITIKVASQFKNIYWLDATDGSIKEGTAENGFFTYSIAPYGSVILKVSFNKEKISENYLEKYNPSKAKPINDIKVWAISAGDIQINNTSLFDWKKNEELKYNSNPATYVSTFTIQNLTENKQYFLDLGKVYYAADIEINGKKAGSEIFEPFINNITTFLKNGENEIKVTITNAKYNDFIGQAEKGERIFKKLKGSETMSSGLIGPVTIYEQ